MDSQNWMTRARMEDADMLYLYTTSMHWSVTQFTPASMEIVPANWRERAFSICVILGAMVIFSSFVSSITNTMNHLRTMNSAERKEFHKLNQYFIRNQISIGLCVRIRKHLDHWIAERQKHLKEADIPLLRLLSEPMQVELHYEVFAPLVRQHPLFEAYDMDFSHSMTRICHRALDQVSISPGDVLFSRGEKASQMFFLGSGKLRYILGKTDIGKTEETARMTRTPGLSPTPYCGTGPERKPETGTCQIFTVHEEEWLSEAVLWSPWVHHGEASAEGQCTLIKLAANSFHEAVMIHNNSAQPAHYAALFIHHYNNVDASHLTDLHMPSFDTAWAVRVAWTDLEPPNSGEH
jgi:hypothetical protein